MRVVGALLALTLVACSTAPAPDPVVLIQDGVVPRMTPAAISSIVLEQIAMMEAMAGRALVAPRIVRMTVTRADQVARVETRAGQGPPDPSVVWVVRAAGTFTTNRGRLGHPIPAAASGFFVISDADGSIVGFGYP